MHSASFQCFAPVPSLFEAITAELGVDALVDLVGDRLGVRPRSKVYQASCLSDRADAR